MISWKTVGNLKNDHGVGRDEVDQLSDLSEDEEDYTWSENEEINFKWKTSDEAYHLTYRKISGVKGDFAQYQPMRNQWLFEKDRDFNILRSEGKHEEVETMRHKFWKKIVRLATSPILTSVITLRKNLEAINSNNPIDQVEDDKINKEIEEIRNKLEAGLQNYEEGPNRIIKWRVEKEKVPNIKTDKLLNASVRRTSLRLL